MISIHLPFKIRRAFSLASVAALCIVMSACDHGPKRALRLNLTPGSTYALTIRGTGNTTVTDATGKENKFDIPTEYTFLLRPGQPDEHGDFAVAIEAGKSTFPFVFAQLSTAFKGYKFGMKISPDGRVVSFSDMEAMRQGIAASFPGQPQVLDGISDSALRALIEPITAVWPPVPVSVGDRWTRTDIFNPSSDSIESTTLRVDAWDNSAVIVKFDSIVKPANKVPGLNLTGKGKGEVHIAAAEGTIRSFESVLDISGTFTDKNSGSAMKISSTYRIQAELTPR